MFPTTPALLRSRSITSLVVARPHAGTEFRFDGRDTFLVGRATDAHLRLSYDDPYFSCRHFLTEANPTRCVAAGSE